jgi:dUTP pyrophosphatase
MAEEIMTLSKALEEYFKNIDTSDIDNTPLPEGVTSEDIKAFIGIISLPDEEFKIVAPMILENIAMITKEPSTMADYMKQLKLNGGTPDDITKAKDEIIESLKDVEGISQIKLDFIDSFFEIFANAARDFMGETLVSIPIQLVSEKAKLPEYAHLTDSGMDLYALEDITIRPGTTVLVPTGIKVAIPEGYELQVRPKSGRCLKTKLRVANTPGTIDAGYRDEIGVIIDNIDPPIKGFGIRDDGAVVGVEYGTSYTIGKGEKFAQLVLVKVPHVAWQQVEDINLFSGDRGGGFGSTGTK